MPPPPSRGRCPRSRLRFVPACVRIHVVTSGPYPCVVLPGRYINSVVLATAPAPRRGTGGCPPCPGTRCCRWSDVAPLSTVRRHRRSRRPVPRTVSVRRGAPRRSRAVRVRQVAGTHDDSPCLHTSRSHATRPDRRNGSPPTRSADSTASWRTGTQRVSDWLSLRVRPGLPGSRCRRGPVSRRGPRRREGTGRVRVDVHPGEPGASRGDDRRLQRRGPTATGRSVATRRHARVDVDDSARLGRVPAFCPGTWCVGCETGGARPRERRHSRRHALYRPVRPHRRVRYDDQRRR